MAKEIERKFLVTDDTYRSMASSWTKISQGYLSTNPDSTVRIRIKDDYAFITVKSRNRGVVRNEWEYEIPLCDAEEIMTQCKLSCLEKIRYIVPFNGHEWEVDEFHGRLSGLVVAEIELANEYEAFDKPSFIGEEVTSDPTYYNSSLIQHISTEIGK